MYKQDNFHHTSDYAGTSTNVLATTQGHPPMYLKIITQTRIDNCVEHHNMMYANEREALWDVLSRLTFDVHET